MKSRFLNLLRSEFTGQRKPDLFGTFITDVNETGNGTIDRKLGLMHEYRYEFRWFNNFYCREKDFSLAYREAQKQLRIDIFGDLIKKIMEIRQAALEGDRGKVLDLLDRLEEEL